MALGINHLPSTFADSTDSRDFSVADTDVSLETGQPGTVNKRTVFQNQIVLHAPSINDARERKQGIATWSNLT